MIDTKRFLLYYCITVIVSFLFQPFLFHLVLIYASHRVIQFFQRFCYGLETFPGFSAGCSGNLPSTVDHSFGSLDHSLRFVDGNPPAASGALQRYEGKYNIDGNCARDLLCFQRGRAAANNLVRSCCDLGKWTTKYCHEEGVVGRRSTSSVDSSSPSCLEGPMLLNTPSVASQRPTLSIPCGDPCSTSSASTVQSASSGPKTLYAPRITDYPFDPSDVPMI